MKKSKFDTLFEGVLVNWKIEGRPEPEDEEIIFQCTGRSPKSPFRDVTCIIWKINGIKYIWEITILDRRTGSEVSNVSNDHEFLDADDSFNGEFSTFDECAEDLKAVYEDFYEQPFPCQIQEIKEALIN